MDNNIAYPIHVLCVFHQLDRGGAESMCMNLYRNIDRSKVQFDFVKHTNLVGAFEEEILSLGGRIFIAPKYKLYNHISYCKWWYCFLKQHTEVKVIHGHYFTISAIFFKYAKFNNCVTIGHSHCTISEGKKRLLTSLKLYIALKCERYSDYCFACSQKAGEWLFPHRDFTVLNNAIDAEQFRFSPAVREEVRKEFRLGDALVLGTVASMQSVKNPFGLLEIFSAVLKEKPDAKLLWVGDGGLRKDIEAKIKEMGLSKNVLLTGVRDDVYRLEQAMDAFLLPSFFEGLPVSAIEAQAAGLPSFLSDEIAHEVRITDLVHFLPLNDYPLWAKEICAADISHRRDTTQEIIDAGYDIHTTAKWLQDFYLSLI